MISSDGYQPLAGDTERLSDPNDFKTEAEAASPLCGAL